MAKKLELIGAIYPWNQRILDLKEGLENSSGDIEIDINSPGGSLTEGIEIYNRIKRYPGYVTMNIISLAASMATYIAIAGDEIVVEENSIFVIHNAMGIAAGDYRAAKKLHDRLEAMTKLIAFRYVSKTGKDIKDIRSKMDDETFFFGNEISKYGFADKFIKSKTKKDKAEIEASAIIEIQSYIDEMKKNEISESDMNKIAAHLQAGGIAQIENSKKETNAKSVQTPDNKGETKPKEEVIMSLKELMTEDPGIKAEVEALIRENYEKGKTAGHAEIEGRITAATPFIGKTEYPDAITNLAIEVIKGDQDATALKGAVVAYDAMNQKKKSDEANGENGEETPPGESPPAVSEDGTVKNEADYQALIGKKKGGK